MNFCASAWLGSSPNSPCMIAGMSMLATPVVVTASSGPMLATVPVSSVIAFWAMELPLGAEQNCRMHELTRFLMYGSSGESGSSARGPVSASASTVSMLYSGTNGEEPNRESNGSDGLYQGRALPVDSCTPALSGLAGAAPPALEPEAGPPAPE